MLRYCTTHGIGYNTQLDPVCPQCSLARMPPADSLEVDLNPASAGFGHPIKTKGQPGDRSLPKVS